MYIMLLGLKETRHSLGSPSLQVVGDSTGQFNKHGHVQLVLVVTERQPDIPANELVEDLEIGRETLEDKFVLFVIDSQLF